MTKGIIYYTDNRLKEPIVSTVQKKILEADLPIVSVSQKPMKFGKNFVINAPPGYLTMIKQITMALEESKEKYVFFCEHDCLYPNSHFDFLPENDNVYYYNANVWRWKYGSSTAITYDRLISLSGLCVNRELALSQYKERLEKIHKMNYHRDKTHEPLWARRWGYEPGTKKRRRGGFSDDEFETWESAEPIVDIRHNKTFSQTKVTKDSFTHQPKNWKEIKIEEINGWDLRQIFKLNK